MRNTIRRLFEVLVLAALCWAAWWSWQTFGNERRADSAPAEVLDIDKDCRVFADSGQCICQHARTGAPLSVPYRECRELARRR